MTLSQMLEQIGAPTKLERDRAEQELLHYPNLLDHFAEIESHVLHIIGQTSSPWEKTFGVLVASRVLCERFNAQGGTNESASMEDVVRLEQEMRPHMFSLHDHIEFRVRIAAGEAMGAFCRICSSWFLDYLEPVKVGIRTHLERHLDVHEVAETPDSPTGVKVLRSKLSTEEIFHDTAGWKSLETWLKCLQSLIRGLGTQFGDLGYCRQDPDILQLIFSCLSHTNRFVRETGYQLLGTLVEEHGCYKDHDSLLKVAQQLRVGLGDNWSQVRMASSVATRQLFHSLSTNASRVVHSLEGDNTVRLSQSTPPLQFLDASEVEPLFPILLPAMCLNRYYIAEGVRLYSQENWRLVTGSAASGSGKPLIERYIQATIDYYLEQSDADNHAVREAACACISELGSKLEPNLLRPYLPRLLDSLVVCFEDDSWPVRDAACVAMGKLVASFPQETLQQFPGDGMWTKFKANLMDSIPSVRQGGAVAAANAILAIQDEDILNQMRTFLEENLLSVKSQAAESTGHGGVSGKPAVYSVAASHEHHEHANLLPGAEGLPLDREEGTVADPWHDERHTNQQMYSCGSLAPKMKKGRKGGGCHDGLFHKPSEPWERTDGCVLLVTALLCHEDHQSGTRTAPGAALKLSPFHARVHEHILNKLIPQLCEIFHFTHYPHHVYLFETLCKCIPRMSQCVGKMKFKPHLQSVIPGLCYSLKCGTSLTQVAAEEAFRSLALQFGPSILRGRVEMHDPAMLPLLQGIL